MSVLKKWPMWLWMLTKRLYKKPIFLILLVLIPLVVLGYRLSIQENGSVMTVGLVQENRDALADNIFTELQSSTRLVRYRIFSTEEEAREHLVAGKVDTVWVFADNMDEKIQHYAQSPTRENAFITVLTRTDNVMTAMVRERLSSTVFKDVAKVVYLNYVRTNLPEADGISDEKLLEYYDNTAFSNDLFVFDDTGKSAEEKNFLLSPLRGLLGVIIALCGLAAAMQFMRDRENGTFAWLSPRWQILPEVSCQLVAVVQLSVIALVCLAFSGLSRNILLELATILLYSLCVASFSMLLSRLCGSIKWMAVLLPVLCVGMLILCPVFLNPGSLRNVQLLLPPTYYIHATYEPKWLGFMALYSAICCGLCALTDKIKRSLKGDAP